MLSIKHKTFRILNKYIKINGIEKISQNEASRIGYMGEDKNKYIYNNNINKKNNKNQNAIYSPILSNKNLNQNLDKDIKNNNILPSNNQLQNLPSNNILEKANSLEPPNNQNLPTENDFSQLLAIMASEKHNAININSYNNTINSNNIDNNNKNSSNLKENLEKESSKSFVSNFFNNRQKTKKDNEKTTTMVIPQESGLLLPTTLNHIFNENKAEKIKEQMRKSRKKENRRKIFYLGKETAKLLKKYKIFLLDKNKEKNKEEIFEIKNKNFASSNSMNKDIKTFSNISLYQNKLILEKIPEFSSDEEYSTHEFDKVDLIQVKNISFSLNAIYQNINNYTNMKYLKNKSYQEKTLKFLKKLMEKENNSNFNNHKISSKMNKSISFSDFFSNKNSKSKKNSKSCSSFSKEIIKSGKLEDILKLSDYDNDSGYKSEKLYKAKKYRLIRDKNDKNDKTDNNIINLKTSLFSSEPNDKESYNNNNNNKYCSMVPRKTKKLNNIKKKSTRKSRRFAKKIRKSVPKLTFNNENLNNTPKNNNFKKRHSKIANSMFAQLENSHGKNIFNSKIQKNFENKKDNHLKPDKKGSIVMKKSFQQKIKSELKRGNTEDQNKNEDGLRKTFEYFAKEEKNECTIL